MNHNMKKRGLALLLACCCVFTAAPVAVKADNVSISTNQTPTGTYSSYTKAEVLKSDTVVYDTLSTSNNVHFYKYTAEKAGYFTVNLAQTSGKGKWNFSVYDADNGNQELETKPLASNYTSRIYNLRPGKSVYIKVERVKSTDITILDYQLTQDYQYSLQVKTTESAQWEQEDNDTQVAATSLQNGTWINGSSYKASDPDAAVYYLARMLYAGEDVKFIARRIMILASEDIGNADPQALQVAVAAAQAVERLGMPEARIVLAQAVTYMASAPKSNSAINAIDKAMRVVQETKTPPVPVHLQDAHYKSAGKLGHGKGYKYAHDYKNHYVKQQYLPDGLTGEVFYEPSENGYEQQIRAYYKKIKENPEE